MTGSERTIELRRRTGPSFFAEYLPEFEGWLEARGYLAPKGPPCDGAREVFFQTRHRENAVRRDGPDGEVLYDKVTELRTRWWSRYVGRSLLRHEWAILHRLREKGVLVPRPWMVSEARTPCGHLRAVLLTERLLGDSLAHLAEVGTSPEFARATLCALAKEVANLHRVGFTFPALFAKHVHVMNTDGVPTIGFLDLATAKERRATARRRTRDLAALGATLPCTRVQALLRARFLKAYCAEMPELGWSFSTAWRRVNREAARLLSKRRHRWTLSRRDHAAARDHRNDEGVTVFDATISESHEAGGPAGWSVLGDRACFRGSEENVRSIWSFHKLLLLFEISAPTPACARFDGARSRATLLVPPDAAMARAAIGRFDFAIPLAELCLRMLGAGLIPPKDLWDHLLIHDGRLHLAAGIPLERPLRMTRWQAQRAVRRALQALSSLSGASGREARRMVRRGGLDIALGRRRAPPLPAAARPLENRARHDEGTGHSPQ